MILQRPYKKFYYTFLQETIYKKKIFEKYSDIKQVYYLIIKLTMIYREENKKNQIFQKYYLEVYILNPILGKNVYKKKRLSSRQPIFVNLKSNTMKNTLQMYEYYLYMQYYYSTKCDILTIINQ